MKILTALLRPRALLPMILFLLVIYQGVSSEISWLWWAPTALFWSNALGIVMDYISGKDK